MIRRFLLRFVFILLIFAVVFIENTSAETIVYTDRFDILDLSKWTPVTTDTWQIINGTVSSTGGRPGLIFEKYDDTQYTSEIDITGNESNIHNFAQVGFYLLYQDSDNYASVIFGSDNRDEEYDRFGIEQKGFTFINTKTYINTSTNTSIEFDPNTFHHLKVVRLNKNIYVYFDDRLALTTEFKDENPSGKVGFDVYESTGYFDNFYLRPITMENASDYINELNLDATTPSTRIGSIYTLHLDGVANNDALFSLNKFGKTVDSTVASEGDIISMNYENGEEGLNFKVTRIFDAQGNSAVWLEDIISASTDELNLVVDEISLDPTYHQEEDMDISFSITNNLGVRYTGTPEITIKTDGSSTILTPEMDLSSGESESFNAVLKAPKKPGSYTVTVSVKTEYSTIEEEVYYRVLALNPAVTALTADLHEDNGIRGTVSLESPFSPDLVDWDMTAVVRVYAVYENGKSQVFFKEVPVSGSTFDIGLSYGDFYQGDGQYLVVVEAGGMQDNEFLEIVGEDFTYSPGRKALPPTIISSDLYPQLMLLLIGMFAAVSVRNHMHPESRSLPLDLVLLACGGAVLLAAIVSMQTDMAIVGIVFTGIGAGAVMAKRSDSPIKAFLIKDSHLHDFAGMLLVFLCAAYIVTQIQQLSFIVIIGTLIVYYTALNLYRGTGGE